MDRVTVRPGQLPLETDLLNAGKFAEIGLAKLAEALLGTTTSVTGFACAPTSPASMSVTVGAGQVYQVENAEATAWSSLPVDIHPILKQGLLLDGVAPAFVAPTTPGYAQNVLIEVTYADADTIPVIRPYYNAANPSSPFSGAANSGAADSTVRSGTVAYQLKYGAAATSGSQTTPTPDAGWVGIYVVTLAYGQTTITQGNISLFPGAPFIATTLSRAAKAASDVTLTSTTSPAIASGTYVIVPVAGSAPPWATLAASGLLTVTVAGLFTVNGNVIIGTTSNSNTTTYYYGLIYKNGSGLVLAQGTQSTLSGAPTTFSQPVNYTFFADVGDTIALYGGAAPGSGSLTAVSLNSGSYLHIVKVA